MGYVGARSVEEPQAEQKSDDDLEKGPELSNQTAQCHGQF